MARSPSFHAQRASWGMGEVGPRSRPVDSEFRGKQQPSKPQTAKRRKAKWGSPSRFRFFRPAGCVKLFHPRNNFALLSIGHLVISSEPITIGRSMTKPKHAILVITTIFLVAVAASAKV